MDLSDLREHYRINESIFNRLMKQVTVGDLIKSIPLFHGTWEKPITPMGVCYYIDDCGDFTEEKTPADKIANAMFKSMDSHDKVEMMMYLDWHHNGDEEDD